MHTVTAAAAATVILYLRSTLQCISLISMLRTLLPFSTFDISHSFSEFLTAFASFKPIYSLVEIIYFWICLISYMEKKINNSKTTCSIRMISSPKCVSVSFAYIKARNKFILLISTKEISRNLFCWYQRRNCKNN